MNKLFASKNVYLIVHLLLQVHFILVTFNMEIATPGKDMASVRDAPDNLDNSAGNTCFADKFRETCQVQT